MRALKQMFLATVLSIGLGAGAATAQTVCMKHGALVALLGERYQEFRHAIALTDSGLMLEVFVSRDGTWTILLTTPDGLACVTASGEAWEFAPVPELPEVST
jgi:hypothetical protein